MCDNVVKLKEVYIGKTCEQNEEDEVDVKILTISIVMNLARHGSLSRFVYGERLNEDHLRVITAQLLLTLDFIHRRGILHRDIKTDNILLLDKQLLKVCITDFGLACTSSDLK